MWENGFVPCLLAAAALAGDDAAGSASLVRNLLAAVVFAVVGIAVLLVCVWIFDKLTPYSFRKEILDDQNTALAIVVGAVVLGVALIIAAAIHA